MKFYGNYQYQRIVALFRFDPLHTVMTLGFAYTYQTIIVFALLLCNY
jgi:hypothetical protein